MKKKFKVEKCNRSMIEVLCHLPESWKRQFDDPPEFPFAFEYKEDEKLYFAGKEICKLDYWRMLDRFDYDADYITFVIVSMVNYRFSEDRYTLLIDWPYNSPIRSVEILKNGERQFLCESPEYTKTNKE